MNRQQIFRRSTVLLAVFFGAGLRSSSSEAFGGFTVSLSNPPSLQHSIDIVLLREGTRTAMTVLASYEGLSGEIAFVFPVPATARREDVTAIAPASVLALRAMDAPRLTEYWEVDPCSARAQQQLEHTVVDSVQNAGALLPVNDAGSPANPLIVQRTVTREPVMGTNFVQGPYRLSIVAARDLVSALQQAHFVLPAGLQEALAPQAREGVRFVIARLVAPAPPQAGVRYLPPIRVVYDSPVFSLPVRLSSLGMTRDDAQDLTVHLLHRTSRFEVANRGAEFALTNQEVRPSTVTQFAGFYRSILDRQLNARPGTVLTEYAGASSSCDPCPVSAGVPLRDAELGPLGAESIFGASGSVAWTPRPFPPVVTGQLTVEVVRGVSLRNLSRVGACFASHATTAQEASQGFTVRMNVRANGSVERAQLSNTRLPIATKQCLERVFGEWSFPPPSNGQPAQVVAPWQLVDLSAMTGRYGSFVLTRLHTKLTRDTPKTDLLFREASPIVGGRENRDQRGILEVGASTARMGNAFQTRFTVRHGWSEALRCDHPRRNVWTTANESGATVPTRVVESVAFSTAIPSAQGLIVPLTVASASDESVPSADAFTAPSSVAASAQDAATMVGAQPSSACSVSVPGAARDPRKVTVVFVSVLSALVLGRRGKLRVQSVPR